MTPLEPAPRRRSGMFARSDIYAAAEEFIEVVAEHADTIWEEDEKAKLTDQLTDKAFEVIQGGETW